MTHQPTHPNAVYENPGASQKGSEVKKVFHLGDVLSITTGRLVSLRHIEGVYDILNHMTNSELWTHQLPGAARRCEGPLLEQHPQLKNVEANVYESNWRAWLDEQVARFGETLEVEQLPEEQQLATNPFRDIPERFK